MNRNWIVPSEDVPVAPPPLHPELITHKYDPVFISEGLRTRIDPMLVKALGWEESSVRAHPPDSHTGAQGLMQLEPATAKWVGGVTDPYNANQSIQGGASYLAYCLWHQDGDVRRALQQYNGSPLSQSTDPGSYASQVFARYQALTGKAPLDFLSGFVRPHATRGPGPAAGMTPAPDVKRDRLGDPMLDSQGNPILKPSPALGPAPVATPIQSPPPPILRPEQTDPPPGHLNMNMGPPGQPNFAQNQPEPLTMALLPPSAGGQSGAQLAFAPTTRGAVPSPLASSLPPSPFVRAFLTNAIFGGGSQAYPFALGTGIRPSGTGGR